MKGKLVCTCGWLGWLVEGEAEHVVQEGALRGASLELGPKVLQHVVVIRLGGRVARGPHGVVHSIRLGNNTHRHY